MERLLKDAQKLTGVKYDIGNLDDVFMAVHAIQEEIGITGTTALEAEETIEGSLNAMKSAFTNTLGALAIGENVKGSFKALAETSATFLFDNLIPMLGEVIMNIPEGITAFIQAAVPKISEILLNALNSAGGLGDVFSEGMYDGVYSAIVWTLEEALNIITEKIPEFLSKGTELVKNIADGVLKEIPFLIRGIGAVLDVALNFLFENVPKFLESGSEIITNLAKGIWDSSPRIVDSITDVLGWLLDTIMAEMPSLLDKGLELIKNLAKGMLDNLPAIMTSITKLLGKLLDAIIEYLPKLLRKGVEIVGNLAQGIWNNLPQIITTIGNLIGQLIGAIGQRIPSFLSMGFSLIIELGEGLIKAIPGIVAKIPQIISALVKTIIKLIPQFVSIGGDLIKGLWKGISNVKDWILGKIKGFVGGITDGIKGFFGIKSPSKVMANEVGQWLPKGLAEGIEDNTRPVSQAMEDLANLTTGTLESELALNAVSTGSLSLDTGTANTKEADRRLYDIIVRALADGTRIEWNDRELGRLVRNFA